MALTSNLKYILIRLHKLSILNFIIKSERARGLPVKKHSNKAGDPE